MYQTKVYKKDSADTLVVANGGKIAVETGGKIGDAPTVADSTAADVPTLVTDFNTCWLN